MMLRIISLALVAYSYLMIRTNLSKLPLRMPVHFNAAGAADGWGSPDILWVLLGAQALACAVFLIVPYLGERFPAAIHVGSRRLNDFTPTQRARVLPLLNDMAGYLSIVMNLFFVFLLHQIIQVAREPIPRLHMAWPLGLLLGGMFGVMLYYLGRIWGIAKGEGRGDPPSALTP